MILNGALVSLSSLQLHSFSCLISILSQWYVTTVLQARPYQTDVSNPEEQ